jgi:hypothetical protein
VLCGTLLLAWGETGARYGAHARSRLGQRQWWGRSRTRAKGED